MKKQTAVEWLYEELKTCIHRDEVADLILDLQEQAKAMEKEQIKEAYLYAFGERDEIDKNLFFNPLAVEYNEKKFNKYLSETYQSNNQ